MPDPLAERPIAIFEFVQLKVEPIRSATNVFADIKSPGQTAMFACAETVGAGLTVIMKFKVVLVQP